ncbi:MAG: hypothetical protein DRG63_07590 [Deltaproteobacteria bacterium]|nr:MAG: hypothetical protein DRG63_07590 [Deltaproteobacteria bacterium]
MFSQKSLNTGKKALAQAHACNHTNSYDHSKERVTHKSSKRAYHSPTGHPIPVEVPEKLLSFFTDAYRSVHEYFLHKLENPQEGTLEIAGERYILVRASSLSLEFFDLVRELYKDEGDEEAVRVAHRMLFDLAHAIGKSDARKFHNKMGLIDPVQRLSAGPLHFAYTGWGLVRIHPDSNLSSDKDFYLSYDHLCSFESDAWLRRGKKASFPVCIMNAGYSSGWCEESFGLPLVAVEIKCKAKGDEICSFIMGHPEKIEGYLNQHAPWVYTESGRASKFAIPEFFQYKRLEADLKKTEYELKRHRDHLEELVRERTAELEQVNKRLEHEIAERKRAELALQRSEERYRVLVEESFDGVFIQKGPKIIFANRRLHEMLGYDYGELIGRDHWVVYHPDYQEITRKRAQGRMQGKSMTSKYEVLLMRKDGTSFPGEVNAKAIVLGGKPGVQVWVKDLTEQKEAEKQKKLLEEHLRMAQKMEAVGTLAGGIAHDFNNLLTAVQGNVSLMLMEIDPDHPFYQPLKIIEKQVKSGAKLTKQLLGYARKEKYEVAPLNLNELVSDVLEAFGRARKDLELQCNFQPDLMSIEADQGQIEQVLWNLLTNAADAMPDGGKVIVNTKNVTHEDMQGRLYNPPPGSYVLLEVIDTGLGMDSETMGRIFEPFFTTKELGRGTGLGLASVYGIVKAHGGFIDVESKVGIGSTFRVYLPASQKTRSHTKAPTQSIFKGKGTVLIVDDEAMVLDITARMVSKLGYEAIPVDNGKKAERTFKENKGKIDLVILDMIMPGMNGRQVYERIKKIDPDVRVLFASGYAKKSQPEDIFQQKGNSFIQKPFTLKDLSKKIQEILAPA